jgi:hypothetical protein
LRALIRSPESVCRVLSVSKVTDSSRTLDRFPRPLAHASVHFQRVPRDLQMQGSQKLSERHCGTDARPFNRYFRLRSQPPDSVHPSRVPALCFFVAWIQWPGLPRRESRTADRTLSIRVFSDTAPSLVALDRVSGCSEPGLSRRKGTNQLSAGASEHAAEQPSRQVTVWRDPGQDRSVPLPAG